MAITDGRTLINAADSATNWVNVSGSAAGTADTDTAIEGSTPTSITFNLTKFIEGLLYNTGGTGTDYTGNHIYVWVNIGVAGLLDTQAAGGIRFRFCGATITDWFEVYIGGSDTYTGGWKMFVIDVDDAHTNPDGTNGTKPNKNAIQYLGVVGDTGGSSTKKQDNFWVDAMWRLPSATPGIKVEGQNTGSVDWTWADIVSTAEAAAWGTCTRLSNGTIAINTPIRFGANDAVTHGFSDTNEIIGWDNQPVATDFYGIEVIGGSGTQSFSMGTKNGTGDDATGSLGCIITADSAGTRWFFDADDANVDACNLYGCTFVHGADFQLDDAAVEVISCFYIDCNSATVSNSLQLRNTIVDANTADGVAFMTTDDLGDLRFCSFFFSDGHGVELTTPRVASQTSKGNRFTGYALQAGTANDRAIYNNSAGAVAISATSGGSVTEHSYRDGTSASTTVTAAITVTFTGIAANTEVRVYKVSDGSEEDGVENSSTSFAASLQSGVSYNVVALNPGYVPIRFEAQTYTSDTSVNLNQQVDRNYGNA